MYVHIPFCAARCDYCDFATWTDRAHLVDDYVDACVRDLERRGARRPRRACSSAAARRRCSTRAALTAHPRRHPARRRRRGDGRVQPRLGRRREAARVPRRGREPGVVRRAVDARRTCSPRSGAPTIPTTSPAPSTGARDAGIERINLDLIYGTPGETRRRLGGDARRRARARARARERLRAHRRAGHAARPGGGGGRAGRARRRRPGHQVRGRRRPARRRRARPGTRSRTGPGPGDECRHNLLYWEGGDYAAIGCAAHGHTRPAAALVERAHARALHRRGRRRARRPRPASEILDRRRPPGEATVLALRTARRDQARRRRRPILSQWSSCIDELDRRRPRWTR